MPPLIIVLRGKDNGIWRVPGEGNLPPRIIVLSAKDNGIWGAKTPPLIIVLSAKDNGIWRAPGPMFPGVTLLFRGFGGRLGEVSGTPNQRITMGNSVRFR